ncbi:MAG: pilus assembly protein PilX [Burkholderiaceae bacterium]|nr:pilus assembly protein PilX [Burkholderiaceae bacterium]
MTPRPPPRTQQGISLLTVLLIMVLSILLALWASRTALIHEMVVGNDVDYQRAFEAAQAMLQDAELDIRGERADGSACTPVAGDSDVCRTGTQAWFVDTDSDLTPLLTLLDNQTATGCIDGICRKRVGPQDFWRDSSLLPQMLAQNTSSRALVGARYGQYTGAQTGNYSNPILKERAQGKGAWYWVEVMPYDSSYSNLLTEPTVPTFLLNLRPQVVYRITAIARGLKPGSQVVLQSTYVRQKVKD